jgi:hypothetical protein
MHQFFKLILGLKLYMFRAISLFIIRSFLTVHSAMVYVIQVYFQLASRMIILLAVTNNFILSCFGPVIWRSEFKSRPSYQLLSVSYVCISFRSLHPISVHCPISDRSQYLYIVQYHTAANICTLSNIRRQPISVHCPISDRSQYLYIVQYQTAANICTLSNIRPQPISVHCPISYRSQYLYIVQYQTAANICTLSNIRRQPMSYIVQYQTATNICTLSNIRPQPISVHCPISDRETFLILRTQLIVV